MGGTKTKCCGARVRILFLQTNGAVVLWRMVARNLFGGANKNDRVEESLPTSSPHKGAVTCLTHTRPGTYGSLGGPLVFSGSTDHTIKVGGSFERIRISLETDRPTSTVTWRHATLSHFPPPKQVNRLYSVCLTAARVIVL